MCDKGKQRESMSAQWFAEAMYTKIIGSGNLTYQGKLHDKQPNTLYKNSLSGTTVED